MQVTILHDYFDTVGGLPCFAKIDGHKVAHLTSTQIVSASRRARIRA